MGRQSRWKPRLSGRLPAPQGSANHASVVAEAGRPEHDPVDLGHGGVGASGALGGTVIAARGRCYAATNDDDFWRHGDDRASDRQAKPFAGPLDDVDRDFVSVISRSRYQFG